MMSAHPAYCGITTVLAISMGSSFCWMLKGISKVLIEDVLTRDAIDLKAWINRHESCVNRARRLLSPKTRARKTNVRLVCAADMEYEWNT